MKNVLGGAALALLAASAAAQSSVAVFGVADAGVRAVKNGHAHRTGAGSGGLGGSYLGLRGTEELGDGASAVFWLESGFDPRSGTADASRFWNRRATLGVRGALGELRFGRDVTPTYTNYSDFDAFGDSGLPGSSKFDDSLGSERHAVDRADNLVTYLTPDGLGGTYARLAYAAAEGVDGNRYLGGRLGWHGGPLDVSAAAAQVQVAPVAGAHRFRTYGLAASYDFKAALLLGYVQRSTFGPARHTHAGIGARIPAGTGQVLAQYTHVTNHTPERGAGRADQFALGYAYNLSKRTSLYGTGTVIRNHGADAYAVAGAPPLAAGERSSGVEVGVHHAF